MNEAQIKHMVDRFLGWRLPADFSPDAGISFEADYNQNTPFPAKHEPVGTNLFDAMQAEAMVRNMIEGLPASFDMRAFSRENLARCTSPNGFNHLLGAWSLSDWMTATLGELGEAANVVKKLNRERDGIPGNEVSADILRSNLEDELADTFIYLDLLAQAAGIDLPEAIRSKFARTSAKIHYVSETTTASYGHG